MGKKSEDARGAGGLSRRREQRLEQQAIGHRWPIPESKRARIISRLLKTIEDPTASHRDVAGASRAILSADALNVADEKRLAVSELAKLFNEVGRGLAKTIPVEHHAAVVAFLDQKLTDLLLE